MTADDVRALLREAIKDAGTQQRFADKHNMSRALVTQTLMGRNRPATYILKALGLRRVISYEVIE